MTRSASRDHDTLERRKATLYCWECDHASPIDGDWVHSPNGDSVTYVCPDCGTAIAERPRRDGDRERGRRPTAAWSRVVRTSVSAWRAGFDAGMTAITATVAPTGRGGRSLNRADRRETGNEVGRVPDPRLTSLLEKPFLEPDDKSVSSQVRNFSRPIGGCFSVAHAEEGGRILQSPTLFALRVYSPTTVEL